MPEDEPVPTATDLYRSADWHEREVYDLFGIDERQREHVLREQMRQIQKELGDDESSAADIATSYSPASR